MTDYKAMIEEHSCKPNQGCGVMTICMCGVAEDMADEIERLRAALRQISHAPNGKVHCADGHEECVLIARAALREKE